MGTGDPAPFPLPPASPRAQPHPQNRVLRDEMRSSIPGTSEAGSAGHLSSGCPLILRSEASVPLPPGGRHPASAEPPCQGYTLTLLDPLVCSAQCSVSLMQICKEGLIKVRRRDTGKLLSPARPAKLFNLLLSCASWELQKGWLTSEALTEGNEQGVQGLGNSTHTGRWVCPALGQDFKTVSHFSYPASGQGAQTPLTLPPLWSLREHPWCPLGSEPQQSRGARGARRGQHPFAGAEVPLACCLEEEPAATSP